MNKFYFGKDTGSGIVHYSDMPEPGETDWGGKGWYFVDETWTSRYGPYKTVKLANEAASNYAYRSLYFRRDPV